LEHNVYSLIIDTKEATIPLIKYLVMSSLFCVRIELIG
jgi:hypothetical protein